MKLLDPTHPFYKPFWVRILTVVFPAVMACIEAYNQSWVWALLFLAVAGYAAYELLIMYDRSIAEAEAKKAAAQAQREGDEE
ncbi:hypothetical protein ASD54_14115 [Rhizobium sp. Root149]|uniref:Membrane-associated protease RseP (Regulator of RpoE activity) n=1 Tax=Rhizobium rhizoryzae TaxID=451876 RepID=A0A7W6LGX9_9HYPH|nr:MULTISPECIES: hypothetical protein [Rhizobium]KQZ50025.1 hypothetical protein ASD54_14115 [Rhizobium sp. Root149]MBB4144153.1 membrane-associated protease RseP (regulator of RpoE activity) [Rhizobium rhizoryzae]